MDDVSPNTTDDVLHNTTDVSRDRTDAPVDVATAAERLGISEEAVRARIRRGKLRAEKVGALWQVYLSGDAPGAPDPASRDTTQQPVTEQDIPPGDVAQHDTPAAEGELAPLIELVREQGDRIAELSAVAAMWQTRALHLEEQVKQLSATVESASEAAGGPERDDQADQAPRHPDDVGISPAESLLDRLRRWMIGR